MGTAVCHAQTADDTKKQDHREVLLNQVVVTGTGSYHRLKDATVNTKVITKDEIQQMGISTFEEALNRLSPSFSFTTNGMGTFTSLNGLTDNYILFLLNGQRMAGDGTGNIDLTMINLNNVKRIEIVDGASSALYGSDAIAGVVNIITDDDSRSGIHASNNFNARSHGRISEAVGLDVNVGKLSSTTDYQYLHADHWRLSPYKANSAGDDVERDKEGSPVLTPYVASNTYHSNNVSQKFTFRATDRLSFYLNGRFYNTLNDRPTAVYKYNMLHENYNWGAGARYSITRKAYLKADFNSDYYQSAYVYNQDVLDKKGNVTYHDGQHVTHRSQHYHQGTLKGVFTLPANNRLTVGGELIKESLTSSSIEVKKYRTTLAAYVQDEVEFLPQLKAVAGVRYTHNKNFGSQLAPNVGLMFIPFDELRLRANYSSGYRAPLLEELYTFSTATTQSRITLPNARLDPERSHYFSLNADYTNRWLSVSATAFYNRLNDMISYVDVERESLSAAEQTRAEGWDLIRKYGNIDRARVTGASVSARVILPAGFTLAASYAYTDGRSLGRNGEPDKRLDKSVYNTVKGSLSYEHTWRNYMLHARLSAQCQDGRYSQTYQEKYPAPGFQIWSLMTTHQFRLAHVTLTPGVGMENIFNWKDDRPWNSNYATLNPGRTYVFSLKVNL